MSAACDRIEALARNLLAQKAAFTRRDLAVNGADLVALGVPRGPAVGALLETLLDEVMSGQTPNDRAALLERAGKCAFGA